MVHLNDALLVWPKMQSDNAGDHRPPHDWRNIRNHCLNREPLVPIGGCNAKADHVRPNIVSVLRRRKGFHETRRTFF
jgi:hypothetical protein